MLTVIMPYLFNLISIWYFSIFMKSKIVKILIYHLFLVSFMEIDDLHKCRLKITYSILGNKKQSTLNGLLNEYF